MNNTIKINNRTNISDNLFLRIVIPFICVSGVSLFPYVLRPFLIYAVGLYCFLFVILKRKRITTSRIIFLSFLLILYMCISLFYTFDVTATYNLLIVYICATSILLIDFTENCIINILKIMKVICLVIALSIIISVFIDNCMLTYFKFIVNPTNSTVVSDGIKKELSDGLYSGFAREKGEAGYIITVGLGIVLASYFSERKITKNNFILLAIFTSALLLTGKRMFIIVVAINFITGMLFSNVKNKYIKIFLICILVINIIFFILNFVPDLANVFMRFMDKDNMETMGDRDMLWHYSFLMISKFFVFGAGFGSYNKFAAENGLLVGNKEWNFNGHNSYYQALGELGILGFAIFLLLIITTLLLTIKLIKKMKKNKTYTYLLFFSFYIQMMLIIYSVTGNPIYTKQIMFCWFFAVSIVIFVNKRYIFYINSSNNFTGENNE